MIRSKLSERDFSIRPTTAGFFNYDAKHDTIVFEAREFLQSILTIESLASSYTVNDDLRRETDTGYREVVPGDKTRRSIARVSLFRDRFWRSSKEREDNAVRSDFFLGGENVIREYLVVRDTTKVVPLSGERR